MVVDISGGASSATPVIDGIGLNRSRRWNCRGGDYIDYRIVKEVEKLNGKELPVDDVRRFGGGEISKTDGRYKNYCKHVIAGELKSSHLSVLQYKGMDLREVSCIIPKGSVYELPDGTKVDINANPEVFNCCEALFQDGRREDMDRYFNENTADIEIESDGMDVEQKRSSNNYNNTNYVDAPIQTLVHQALLAVDVDARKELSSNLVVVGGSSTFPGFDARLMKEMISLTPSTVKNKIISGTNIERSNASWIGGSILSSLGSFQQLWLSKEEYEEYGVVLGAQRFT